jgi:hypothetical protein
VHVTNDVNLSDLAFRIGLDPEVPPGKAPASVLRLFHEISEFHTVGLEMDVFDASGNALAVGTGSDQADGDYLGEIPVAKLPPALAAAMSEAASPRP